MAKQYAFWKMPNSSKAPEGKNDPTRLIQAFVKEAIVSSSGELAISPLSTATVLESALEACLLVYDDEDRILDGGVAWSLFRRAVVNYKKTATKSSEVNCGDLMRLVNDECSQYNRQSVNNYHLITSLSIKEFPAKSIASLGCKVFPKQSIAQMQLPESLHRVLATTGEHTFIGNNFPVAVAVAARSTGEAVDRALRSLSFLRGVWTFVSGQTTPLRLMRLPGRKPLGLVHTGRFHLLFLSDGTPASDCYWYEHHTAEGKPPFTPHIGWKHVEKSRRWILQKLRHNPFAEAVANIFIRYAAALDHADHDTSFLQLWNLLETITQTASNEETIERASWIFHDREYQRQLLKAMQVRRNQYVHASHVAGEGDRLVFIMKYTIDAHLHQLVSNRFGLKSLSEYSDLLRMPRDKPVLVERARRARDVLAWLQEK